MTKTMKKILLIGLLGSNIVLAQDIAFMPNRAGGGVVLTNDECVLQGKIYKSLNHSYAIGAGGQTIDSCYFIDNNFVVMGYEDGTKYRYPVDNFQSIDPRNKRDSVPESDQPKRAM